MTRAWVTLSGFALAAAFAWNAGMSRRDALVLTGVAAGGTVAAGAAGLVVLHAMRSRTLRDQVVTVGLVTSAATAAGVAGAAQAMFVSAHDLHALVVVLCAAGTVGAVVALTLARRLVAGTRSLEALAARIGEGDGLVETRSARSGASEELASLAARLEESAARLHEARGRERALESSRRELVAWVSHDLRTPLAGIRAMSEALEDGVVEDPAEVARYHTTIRRETERLSALVDDLFELSRIQAAAIELSVQRVSLRDVVSDAVATVTASARAKQVALRGATGAPSPVVEASVPELLRVVRNLLDNAIRHSPAGGEVVVETGGDGAHAWVTVCDSCGGIPDEDLDRVFDLAFRGDRARTPVDPGGGLGLAIARGLVEAHDGDICVENAGSGCRFTVRLPSGTP